jgi:hypothetical protein
LSILSCRLRVKYAQSNTDGIWQHSNRQNHRNFHIPHESNWATTNPSFNSKRACILIIYVDLMATKPMASSDQLHLEVIFWLLSPSTKFPLRTFNMLVLMDFIFNLECIYIYIVLQNICFGNCKFWELEMDFFPCLLSRSKNHGLNTNGYFHYVRVKNRPFCRLMNNSFY